MIISISIEFPGNDDFIFIVEKYSIMYRHQIFFTHSSVNGHLSLLHTLALMNKISINRGVQTFLQYAGVDSLGAYTWSVFSAILLV